MRGPAIIITALEQAQMDASKVVFCALEKFNYLDKKLPYHKIKYLNLDCTVIVQPDMRLADFQRGKRAGMLGYWNGQ